MDKESAKSVPDASVEVVKPFAGYTLEQLRYQRVLTMAKAEMEKIKLINAYDKIVHGSNNGNGSQGIISRMLGAVSYFDYGVIAFRIGSKIFRTIKALKK